VTDKLVLCVLGASVFQSLGFIGESRVAKRLLSKATANNSWIGTLWHPSSGCQRSIADLRGWSLRDDPGLLRNITGTDSATPIRRPSIHGLTPVARLILFLSELCTARGGWSFACNNELAECRFMSFERCEEAFGRHAGGRRARGRRDSSCGTWWHQCRGLAL